ncbi:MAG: hypothetical protein IPG25_17465 [Proteobacteria bacterium]|nr:hypothetical protein [Pseudomonadota bacterium]
MRAIPQRFAAILGALVATIVIAACGSKSAENQAATSAGSASRRAASQGNATAEEVAAEARGDVECPAKIESQSRAANAPVDDVVGVRPGMTYEEAAYTVLCTDQLMVVSAPLSSGINMKTYGQTVRQGFTARLAEPRVQKSSKQIMQEMQDDMMARSGNRVVRDMQPGQSKWSVSTMGLPGQERVIHAAREEWFEADRNPLIANVEQALIEKYGTPTKQQHSSGLTYLTWAYDPLGRRITETSRLFNQCSPALDPDGGTNYSPDCGLVIGAFISPLKSNPQLAEFMQAGVINQSGGYDLVVATEQTLQGFEQQRQARQVQDAAKNADKPQL